MIIGPWCFFSPIKIETSLIATLLSDNAHKNGESTTTVKSAANAFPNWEFSTIGRIKLEESKMIAIIMIE